MIKNFFPPKLKYGSRQRRTGEPMFFNRFFFRQYLCIYCTKFEPISQPSSSNTTGRPVGWPGGGFLGFRRHLCPRQESNLYLSLRPGINPGRPVEWLDGGLVLPLPSTGIEPVSQPSEGYVLSIRLRGQRQYRALILRYRSITAFSEF